MTDTPVLIVDSDREAFNDWVYELDNQHGNATKHEKAIAWRVWQAARDHYAPKLTEAQALDIIMQTDIGIAGDMCIAENHAKQLAEKYCRSDITDKKADPLWLDNLITACIKTKEWFESEHSDTDFDANGYLAETHAELSNALYDARKAIREPRPIEINKNAQAIYESWLQQKPSEQESVCALAHKCYAAGFNEGVDKAPKREDSAENAKKLQSNAEITGDVRLALEQSLDRMKETLEWYDQYHRIPAMDAAIALVEKVLREAPERKSIDQKELAEILIKECLTDGHDASDHAFELLRLFHITKIEDGGRNGSV